MNFNNSIMLDTYSNNANKQFGDMQSRLSEIENSFQTRMNGKTTVGLVGSLVGNILWLVVFIACAVFVRNMVNSTLLIVAMSIVAGLVLFMMIDNIMDFSYYGKIASYKNSISQLQSRINIGSGSIMSNHDEFMASKSTGWNYPLNAAPSILEEAISVETTMTSMETLKKGFINGAKNFFFYTTVVATTIVGCIALFPAGSGIITGTIGSSISTDTLMVFNVIALIITGIGEIILASLVWSQTDCSVTNMTLLILALSPIAFLALILIATLIVTLVIWLVGVLISILAVIVVGATILGALSGG